MIRKISNAEILRLATIYTSRNRETVRSLTRFTSFSKSTIHKHFQKISSIDPVMFEKVKYKAFVNSHPSIKNSRNF